MAGFSIKNQSFSNIILKELKSSFYYFKTQVTGRVQQLIFNDDGSIIAVYTYLNMLFVWNTLK
jgi:hypothetical protein